MISIIITAYKEEKTIGRAIQACLDNKIKEDFEILVFAPDEKTLNEVKKFSRKNKKIKAIKDAGEGKPAALNQAFKKAKGDILILTDGDVYISKKAIAELSTPFKESAVGAVTGRPVSIDSRKKMLGFWGHLLTNIADLRRKKAQATKKRFYCSGYLFAMRSKLKESVPKNTLSEDGLISHGIYSKGHRIVYAPRAEVYVKYPTNLRDWLNQKRRSAGGYNQIKMWTKKEIRSFSKESLGMFQVLKYPQSFKEFLWTIELIFIRLYLWIIIFKDINLKKKDFNKIWVRIESTK